MGTWQLWQRLLWKEARESWPVLGISLALPLLLFLLMGLVRPNNAGMIPPFEAVVALLSILTSLWAVDRVYGKALVRRKARTQLPVPAQTRWLATYLLPLLIPLVAGSTLGLLFVEYKYNLGYTHFGSPLPEATYMQYYYAPIKAVAPYVPPLMLYMLANFLLCTTLTSAFSPIPAVMAGAGLALSRSRCSAAGAK